MGAVGMCAAGDRRRPVRLIDQVRCPGPLAAVAQGGRRLAVERIRLWRYKACMDRTTAATAGQIRAARALLGVDQVTLARGAGISVATLRRAEAGHAPSETIQRVAEVLEQAGVRFVQDGVQLRPAATEARERKRRIEEILVRFDAAPDIDSTFTDASLYDEHGLPG